MDKAQKIKELMNSLKQGKDLTREDAVIMKPVTIEMILGFDEMTRQKSKLLIYTCLISLQKFKMPSIWSKKTSVILKKKS